MFSFFFETLSKLSVFNDSKHYPSYANLFAFIWKEKPFQQSHSNSRKVFFSIKANSTPDLY